MARGVGRASWGLIAAVAIGCGTPITRHPVPANLRDSARVEGMPDGIRAWGDQFSPTFQHLLDEAGPQATAAYGAKGQPHAALAISGGGSNGAFAAGLVCGWTRHGDRPVFRIVTGISAGAIVAPFAFLGPGYDGPLRRMATQIDDPKVYTAKGLLAAFGSDSLTDTRPLARFLAQFYDARLIADVAAEGRKGRRLYVATTDLDAQRPVLWDLTRIAGVGGDRAVKLFRAVILASAAQPVVFPPVYLPVRAGGKEYDEMHVDGGTATQVVLYGNVLHMPELIQRHAKEQGLPAPIRPIVYVVRNAKLAPEPEDVEPRLFDIAQRSVNMLVKAQGMGDVAQVYDVCRRDGLDFRLATIPDDATTNAGQGFDPKTIQGLFDRGFQLGRAGYRWMTEPPTLKPTTLPTPQLP